MIAPETLAGLLIVFLLLGILAHVISQPLGGDQ